MTSVKCQCIGKFQMRVKLYAAIIAASIFDFQAVLPSGNI